MRETSAKVVLTNTYSNKRCREYVQLLPQVIRQQGTIRGLQMANALPAPRQFLTKLVSSLPAPASRSSNDPPPSNPLRGFPSSSKRNILVTLHCLYPSLLLPALDLLDRGLVTRVVEITAEPPVPLSSTTSQHVHLPQEDVHLDNGAEKDYRTKEQGTNIVYLVRSAQESRSKSRGLAASITTYTVRASAWNCSCAAFAFSAFPAQTSQLQSSRLSNGPTMAYDEWLKSCDHALEDEDLEFGGLSKDGNGEGGGAVPLCKHLLAVVLVQRWHEVLGPYVKVRKVGRHEMAGLAAQG